MYNSDQKLKVAIVYNFEEVLLRDMLKESTILDTFGIMAPSFWAEVENIANARKMDAALSYMYLLLQEAKEQNIKISREGLRLVAQKVRLNDGLETWFDRINSYADEKNIELDHYAITTNFTEIVEGTEIGKYFKNIYGNEYMYNKHGSAIWPASSVNYVNRTQFFLRINRGAPDLHKQRAVNKFIPTYETLTPFSNIIYLGNIVNDNAMFKNLSMSGGVTFGMGRDLLSTELSKSMREAGRLDYTAPVNFSENSEIETKIKEVIDNIIVQNKFED